MLSALLIEMITVIPYGVGFHSGYRTWWITFGPFNFYIARISLPILIVYLWKLSINKNLSLTIGLKFIIEGILLMNQMQGKSLRLLVHQTFFYGEL